MAVPRPSTTDIAAAASHFGFRLDADALAAYTAIAGYTLTSYDAVDELYDQLARHKCPSALTDSRSRPTIRSAPGMSPPRSAPAHRDRCRAGPWRSRTTSPSQVSR